MTLTRLTLVPAEKNIELYDLGRKNFRSIQVLRQ